MWQEKCGDSRALSFKLKLLEGQIPASLKEFCPFVWNRSPRLLFLAAQV